MGGAPYLPTVRDQYERYPFPRRDPGDESRRLVICELDLLGKINHYCFQGRQGFDRGFRALVAGGGTGDAAIFLAEQLRDRDAQVVYLDISQSSMDAARRRAEIRGLQNIAWVHGSIMELPSLGLGTFDYINCAGVLHHLEDPDAGLRCLAAVLDEDGGMGLMVYGRYGRLDIYATQDLMRLVNKHENTLSAKVDNAKSLLKALPETNFLLRGHDPEELVPNFIEDEPNLVDAFLHEQDRAYSVGELYALVEQANLRLVEFTNFRHVDGNCRLEYAPALYIHDRSPLAAAVSALSEREQQGVAEIINGCLGLHAFYVSRRPHATARFDYPRNVPYFLTTGAAEECQRIAQLGRHREITVRLRNSNDVTFDFGPFLADFLRLVDGRRELGTIWDTILRSAKGQHKDLSQKQLVRLLLPDWEIVNAMNWVVLRHRSTPETRPVEAAATFRVQVDGV